MTPNILKGNLYHISTFNFYNILKLIQLELIIRLTLSCLIIKQTGKPLRKAISFRIHSFIWKSPVEITCFTFLPLPG